MAKKKAEPKKAAAKPKGKGRNGTNKLPSRAAAARHARVIELRAGSATWATVAREVGMTAEHCQRVWKKWVSEGKLSIQQTDPIAVVFEQIARLDRSIEELAGVLASADSSSAAVGAIRAKAALMAQQAELLQAVGLMPRNIGTMHVEVDVRFTTQQLLVLLEEFVPPERIEEAEDRLLKLMRRVNPLAAEQAALN